MSEAKSMRKLDKHLARSHKALHDALELFRLLNSIRGRGDEPQGGYAHSHAMISELVLTAFDSVNKAIDHYENLFADLMDADESKEAA